MRRLKTRRADRCRSCEADLPIGTNVWWDAKEKVVRCLPCVGSPAVPASEVPTSAEEPTVSEVTVVPDVLVPPEVSDTVAEQVAEVDAEEAGRSARQEYERRAARHATTQAKAVAADLAWREEVVERRPVVGRLAAAVTPRPTIEPETQSTTAWKVGAEGEERVAEVLRDVAGIEVLHDRRVPKSRANIDHLVVGPSGVFVVDAKKYKAGSAIEVRDVGPLWRADVRLYVGGRDRTKLVEGVTWQMEVVRAALGAELVAVPVTGVLCFIGGTWGWRKKPKTVRGVTSVWPSGLPGLVAAGSPEAIDVERVAAHLRTALPPAAP